MNCDQVRSELIAYLKGELDTAKARMVEEHLVRCPSCRQELEGARRLLSWTEAASEKAVTTKTEEIIDNAVRANASDIHLDPLRDGTLLVRYRVDGVLHGAASIDSTLRYGIVTRLKMLAEMSVSEASLPQDGRMRWAVDGKDYDLRITTLPFIYGEGVTLRILNQSDVMIGLDRLGFYDDHMQAINHLLHQPNGLIIVAGPTGSGKTTTAYSMLQILNTQTSKVVTVENPVEYALRGISQSQVNSRTGFTFASAIRAILRLDPDVIYVGEIRDYETMILTSEMAITGHLAITTLFPNDAAGVLQRLKDMGMEPFLTGAALIGVIAQRLARKVCDSCKEAVEYDANDPKVKALGITAEDLKNHTLYRGRGCDVCRNTGYKGRIGIYEVLTMDKDIAAMIGDGAPPAEVIETATRSGFLPMRADGKRKVLDGITTVEEVFRVLV